MFLQEGPYICFLFAKSVHNLLIFYKITPTFWNFWRRALLDERLSPFFFSLSHHFYSFAIINFSTKKTFFCLFPFCLVKFFLTNNLLYCSLQFVGACLFSPNKLIFVLYSFNVEVGVGFFALLGEKSKISQVGFFVFWVLLYFLVMGFALFGWLMK